jgi:hypothetical protein
VKRVLVLLLLANLAFFGYARLAGEPEPAPAAGEASATPVPRLALVSELKAPSGPSCLSVGPFGERATADEAARWLRGARRLVRERSAEIDGAPTFWVAQTTPTLQQAARVAMRLRAAGVTDVEVTPPGTNQTQATVSLGVYSDRERAERRVTELRRLGVNASIVEQAHKVTQWWLDLPQRAGDAPLDVAALVKAVPAAAGVSAPACPAAAPAAPADAPAATPAKEPPAPA